MADHACFVFFNDRSIDLQAAATALRERGLTVNRNGSELEVGFSNKPRLRVVLVTGEHVREEAAEFGKETPFDVAMSRCNSRFEILIENLADSLDEMNTLIDVQGVLQDLTRGYIFCSWNGELTGPDFHSF